MLDREVRDNYTIEVNATDLGIPQRWSVLTLIVKVTDVNDNTPTFAQNTSSAYIIEESPVDSVIALLTATDEDNGNNGTVKYSLRPSNVSRFFKVDEHLGLVRICERIVVNNLVEDGILISNETENIELNLTITATDKGTPQSLSSDIQLIVHLEPVNDNAPVFEESLYTFNNVTENLQNGKNFCHLNFVSKFHIICILYVLLFSILFISDYSKNTFQA